MNTRLHWRLWTTLLISAALGLTAALIISQFLPNSLFGSPPPFRGDRDFRGDGPPRDPPRPDAAPGDPDHNWPPRADPGRFPGPPGGPGGSMRRRQLVDNMLVAALVAIGAGIGTFLLLRRTTRRIERLRRDVGLLAEGRLDLRTVVDGDDEIGELARDLNRAVERIGQLTSSHQNLLANSSHELRSPLTRVRLALELLSDQYEGLDGDPRFREVRRNIAEIDQLIDEILTASTLESSPSVQVADEPVNLDAIADQELQRLGASSQAVREPAAGSPSIASEASPIRARVDPVLFRRLLRNLLENAEKYGDGQAIRLSLARDDQHVLLKVSDQGLGVPESERERIFDPFYRRRGASESRGGVGLGLALVRQIAVLHHGSVWCEPNQPHGSVFVCRLPVTGPEGGDTPPPGRMARQ